jgi:hypothetical protein
VRYAEGAFLLQAMQSGAKMLDNSDDDFVRETALL